MRQESFKIMNAVATSATNTYTSAVVDLTQSFAWSLTATFTGGTPAGNLSFQASNDGETWVNIETATSISAAGNTFKNYPDIGYSQGRVTYTNTSGTSSLTVWVSKKGA